MNSNVKKGNIFTPLFLTKQKNTTVHRTEVSGYTALFSYGATFEFQPFLPDDTFKCLHLKCISLCL